MKTKVAIFTAFIFCFIAMGQDTEFTSPIRLNHWTTTTEGTVSNDIANIALSAAQTNLFATTNSPYFDIIGAAAIVGSNGTNLVNITSNALSLASKVIGVSASNSIPNLAGSGTNNSFYSGSGANIIHFYLTNGVLAGYLSVVSGKPKWFFIDGGSGMNVSDTNGNTVAYFSADNVQAGAPVGGLSVSNLYAKKIYGAFLGTITNGGANFTTQTNMTLYSTSFNSTDGNVLFYTTIGGITVLDSSAPYYGTLAGGAGSALVQVTNIANSRISAQTLTPSNVNTNLWIAGHSQEDINTNIITIRDTSSNDVNLVYSFLTNNSGTITWTNLLSGYSIRYVPSVPTNTFFIRDNLGNSLFFTTNSPQNFWQYNFYTSGTLPTGDWGRISDFSTNGNAGAFTITNLPANSIANGITSNQIVSINASQVQGSLPASDLNGLTITNITISGLTLMLTNTAPSDAVMPKVWFVITNSANVYKVAGYQ